MDFEEPIVNESTEAEDSLPEELIEDTDDNEEDLDSFLDEETEETEEEEPAEEPAPEARKEPGYVQKRISKAVAATEAKFQAQIQALEAQYAPLKERLLEMDAQELVRQGEFKSVERAKEYLKLKQGLPTQEQQEQPRNDQGQFTSREQQAVDQRTQGRIDELKAQAAKIKAKTGLDVIAEWNRNEEIKNAVIDGTMDFYDVAEQMQKPKKRPPSPSRSPNGVSGFRNLSITNMSDAQFAKFDKMLDQEGVRFTIKR
jgi:hypothetical protein